MKEHIIFDGIGVWISYQLLIVIIVFIFLFGLFFGWSGGEDIGFKKAEKIWKKEEGE